MQEWVKDGAPEDVEGWLKGRAPLMEPAKDSTIKPDTKEAGSADVRYIGKIDRELYKCVTPDITTDEVVITNERILHIKERDPNDFERFQNHIVDAITRPDYILEDAPNTALVLKSAQNGDERFRLVLRLKTSNDPDGYKNSIITFMTTNKKKWNQNLRNKGSVPNSVKVW